MLIVLLISFFAPSAAEATEKPVRFGLTAVVVRENLRFFDEMSDYLSKWIGHPVVFVQRKSYREIMDLLKSGNLDFAWICGYPFVQERNPEFLKLVAVPIYKGKPFYRSFIIVHKDSPYEKISDLKKQVFAYSDSDSNSGFLYPRYYLTQSGEKPDEYFRQTFFTYNHAETVEAVAFRVADGGAVDSYILEFLQKTNPQIASKTRIIHSSPLFGFPPIVAHSDVPDILNKKMTDALTGMNSTPEGRRLLDILHLDALGEFDAAIFDDIRFMAEKIKGSETSSNLVKPQGAAFE